MTLKVIMTLLLMSGAEGYELLRRASLFKGKKEVSPLQAAEAVTAAVFTLGALIMAKKCYRCVRSIFPLERGQVRVRLAPRRGLSQGHASGDVELALFLDGYPAGINLGSSTC